MNLSMIKLSEAFQFAISIKPKVDGFPVLAEVLRQAGVKRNIWSLPSCQSIYVMDIGNIVNQGSPLVVGMSEITKFNEASLVEAIRTDQNGESTFSEFLESVWKAGVVSYEVNFERRTCAYHGVLGESYIEDYSSVEVVR